MGKKENEVYLGLDIGTDSVGYAVTDEEYNLLRFRGNDAWGAHIFDEASLSEERRSFRSARRRLDRRQQRVNLVEELFAPEIGKIDKRFFIRQQESFLFREDCEDKYVLFNDDNYTDVDYFNEYKTIHHLLVDLMENKEPHDIRLVYLACAWLVAHRGHFFSNISKENISQIKDFNIVYDRFLLFFSDNGFSAPWGDVDREKLGNALKMTASITNKNKELIAVLLNGKKPGKLSDGEGINEDFPFSQEGIIKLLAGGTYSLSSLFGKDEYDSIETKSISLGMDDDKLSGVMADIGEDYELIKVLRSLYDWAVLVDVLGDGATISESKKKVYEQHEADLKLIKRIVKKYIPEKYDEMFRVVGKDNYAAYVYHSDETNRKELKKKGVEDFSKFALSILKGITVSNSDKKEFDDMISRLELRTFLPKQKNTDNRVIPHQLYWYELKKILSNAEEYLPFLKEKDKDGISVSKKIEDIFLFRVPYYVGPLNGRSEHAWLVRKQKGKIYPWNFEDMIDLDETENAFIRKLTNTCTYLPDQKVLPKDSLLYHKFAVLNEINNIRINGVRISVELKQQIYNEVFLQKKKVTRKYLMAWLAANGIIEKGMEESVTGLNDEIQSNLVPQISFKKLMESGALSEDDVEKIIERAAYAEDKSRLYHWLEKVFPSIGEEDRRYICSIKIGDFGRLSKKLLNGIEGVERSTGEVMTIISALWNTENNLMEIIAGSDLFTFSEVIEEYRRAYYAENKMSLEDRLDEMYLSNAVKRSVYRTLDIVKDVKKAFGTPDKIFVEMARGGNEDQKGKRTKSRKQQILDLYAQCKDEDVRLLKKSLEEMGDAADSKLQGDKLFLYYMQLGKSMYSGKSIDLERLGNNSYCDIDHIYPQAYVKDDSIINNKVLVFSEENGAKMDVYPIADNIRHKMAGYWNMLHNSGLISDEKFKRLTRGTSFSDEEKIGFINRQITETTQSTKAVATLLKEIFPKAEIVYSKARLTTEFRQEFDIYKSRTFNDLHHAVDAYLNIVTGNVYNMKFTKHFMVDQSYSIKTKTVFTHPVIFNGKTIWDGKNMLAKVKETASKNSAHFTKFAFFKKGGFFDQMPVSAQEGLVPIKKGMPTEKYGGYNKAGAMFYIPVRYTSGKKSEVIIMSVELLHGNHFLSDEAFAKEYSFGRIKHITGKNIDSVEFPMGMRPWKVNTVLSLDGFRVCIAGIGSGGKCLVAQSIEQFSDSSYWKYYIKKLEVLVEKVNGNPKYVYDETYDKVSEEKNIELYDKYMEKLEKSIYSKRINNPIAILKAGRCRFVQLDVIAQAKSLLNIHQIFGRLAGGCDLTAIGGTGKAAATVNFSSTVSNWSNKYKEVRIIDSSASGLWEIKSQNLLDLL